MEKERIGAEYRLILGSLEIPKRPLNPRSQKTPEWEILEDIKEEFCVPTEVETLEPLANYLSNNVPFDDFFSFLGFLIRPFAQMVVEIYDFLSQHQQVATSSQTISEIRIGSQTAFPVDLSYMPKEWIKILFDVQTTAWNVNVLLELANHLNTLNTIAICDGISSGNKCESCCFQECRSLIQKIKKDIESILESNARIKKMIETNEQNNVDQNYEICILPEKLIEQMESFLNATNDKDTRNKAASDCIGGQRNGFSMDSLFTFKHMNEVREILNNAKRIQTIRTEALKEFLKLPYWRHRNDLYEIWVLIKTCSLFPNYCIKFCTIDFNGSWNIPGNKQGKISEPILKLLTPTGVFQIFTGLELKGFYLPFEKHNEDFEKPHYFKNTLYTIYKKSVKNTGLSKSSNKITGAMPDWLFCREVDSQNTFDFNLLVDESERFKKAGLVPEFIIECKAGTSYGLLKTINETMVNRYLPLLRTEKGKALLVNYRQFNANKILCTDTQLRDNLMRKYTQLLVLEQLHPGQKEVENDFLAAIREKFRITDEMYNQVIFDIMLVFDTTGSMESSLQVIKQQLIQVITTIKQEITDLRVGVIAVGDYFDEPSLYDIKLYPLSNKMDDIVCFIQKVPVTDGGDDAEAYEDALHALAVLQWRAIAQKIVVFVGDAYPHSAAECPKKIDWKEQVTSLKRQNVSIYGIQLSDSDESKKFFEYMCSEVSGKCVQSNHNSDIASSVVDFIRKVYLI